MGTSEGEMEASGAMGTSRGDESIRGDGYIEGEMKASGAMGTSRGDESIRGRWVHRGEMEASGGDGYIEGRWKHQGRWVHGGGMEASGAMGTSRGDGSIRGDGYIEGEMEASGAMGKHVRESTGSLELVIREVRKEDTGRWTCSGATANTEVSKAVTLIVMEDLRLSPTPPLKYSVRPYHSVVLQCDVRGSPSPIVGWSWAGRPIVSGGNYLQESSGLRVLNVTSAQGGVYTCQAHVPETGRFRSWDIQLEVLAPPTVTIEISNLRAGSFSALICTGSGTPTPRLSWFKDQTPIVQEDDRIKLEWLEEAGKSSMSIIFIPLEGEDEGNYTCVAQSEEGRAQKSFLLQPLRPPAAPGNVRVVRVSPDSVTLAISPPEEDNRPPVLEYHVAYISMQNFEQTRRSVEAKHDEDVLVELVDLTSQTTYRVRIYAKNIVDFGSFKELYISTS
ncbi:hemicentin-2-like [Liolophura sinensis]|uniref:hemicentin-2-like n=1 Tax=Liolophura sinensis TaxID=3198878 RepID=UPI0031583CFF